MTTHYRIPSSATLRERIARRQAEIAELRALLDVARTREAAAAAHGVRGRRRRPAPATEASAAERGESVRP